MPTHAAVSSPDLAEILRSWGEDALVSLLRQRPDLATPAPTSITALASRALSRGSLTRALATLDVPTSATAEAVGLRGNTTVAELGSDLGRDVSDYLRQLQSLALVLLDGEAVRPVDGLAEVLGPHPLGLGPALAELHLHTSDGWPTTTRALTNVLKDAPDGARQLLEALAWGPPIGTVNESATEQATTLDIPAAARWLLEAHILHRRSATELVLPREVGLAARHGRLVRTLSAAPPLPEAPIRTETTIAAESVRAAEDLTRAIDAVIEAWRRNPARVLRAGGVAVRDLRQLAAAHSLTQTQVAFATELTARLGLIGQLHTDNGSVWAPTGVAEVWASRDLAQRWAELVHTWLTWARTPWLAGTRSDKGALRAALGPDLDRAWAPVLRRRILATVAAWPEGAAPDLDQVRDRLAWFSARSVPPRTTVAAVLDEASALGITGAGALSAAARTLLPGSSERPSHAPSWDARAARLSTAEAFANTLPETVEELIIQGDLTGIVPGRPGPELAALLAEVAEVESQGDATTVRFTTASVRRALAAGLAAEELLSRLRSVSIVPLPQPLEYLVRDTARTYGQVRVGAARSYVRVDDPAAAVELTADPRLSPLDIRMLAPGVLISDAEPGELLHMLREIGAAPVLEGPDGNIVSLPATTHRAARAALGEREPETPTPLAEVVAHMRAGEGRALALLADRSGAQAPADLLEVLRVAARAGTEVELVMAGAQGNTESRTVRPINVDCGRVRVIDMRRDAEITVAPHRIVSVRPVQAS